MVKKRLLDARWVEISFVPSILFLIFSDKYPHLDCYTHNRCKVSVIVDNYQGILNWNFAWFSSYWTCFRISLWQLNSFWFIWNCLFCWRVWFVFFHTTRRRDWSRNQYFNPADRSVLWIYQTLLNPGRQIVLILLVSFVMILVKLSNLHIVFVSFFFILTGSVFNIFLLRNLFPPSLVFSASELDSVYWQNTTTANILSLCSLPSPHFMVDIH